MHCLVCSHAGGEEEGWSGGVREIKWIFFFLWLNRFDRVCITILFSGHSFFSSHSRALVCHACGHASWLFSFLTLVGWGSRLSLACSAALEASCTRLLCGWLRRFSPFPRNGSDGFGGRRTRRTSCRREEFLDGGFFLSQLSGKSFWGPRRAPRQTLSVHSERWTPAVPASRQTQPTDYRTDATWGRETTSPQ
jgi:hypothetical protein